MGFPCSPVSKETACNAGDLGSIPGWERFPWKRKCQPTPVFLPGESHEQRHFAGYSPWGCKESEMTEQLSLTHTERRTRIRRMGNGGDWREMWGDAYTVGLENTTNSGNNLWSKAE